MEPTRRAEHGCWPMRLWTMMCSFKLIQSSTLMREVTQMGVAAAPRMKVIARCTPTLGMVSVFWHTAVESLAWPMNVIKAPLTLIDDKPDHLRTGNEIAEARNYIVAKALSF